MSLYSSSRVPVPEAQCVRRGGKGFVGLWFCFVFAVLGIWGLNLEHLHWAISPFFYLEKTYHNFSASASRHAATIGMYYWASSSLVFIKCNFYLIPQQQNHGFSFPCYVVNFTKCHVSCTITFQAFQLRLPASHRGEAGFRSECSETRAILWVFTSVHPFLGFQFFF